MALKIINKIKTYIKDNKYTFIGLFTFYIIGILLGSFAVNDLDYQQKDDMTKYLNGFLKILNSDEVTKTSLFKISLLDNFKTIIVFWILGFTIIGIPVYYIILGMRGFITGFSSGVIMAVLGTKGILISSLCFLPKEIIVLPCLIALAVNGTKLSKAIFKKCVIKAIKEENLIKQKIGTYSFVTALFSIFLFLTAIFDAYISTGTLNLLSQISS